MNINCISKSPTFKSNYSFNITSENWSRADGLMTYLSYPEINDNSYRVVTKFMTINPSDPIRTFEKVHISANDSYDGFIESNLKQRNIDFTKQSASESLKHENIYNRIILPEQDSDRHLVSLDTRKVEELFQQNEAFYVPKNGGIKSRYRGAKDFFTTGEDIEATKASIYEQDGKLHFSIIDGRHRFAVMRDMGMKKVKFSLDRSSAEVAEKYGLISQ